MGKALTRTAILASFSPASRGKPGVNTAPPRSNMPALAEIAVFTKLPKSVHSGLSDAPGTNKKKGSVGRDVYVRDWYYVNSRGNSPRECALLVVMLPSQNEYGQSGTGGMC